ncbi:hypothetical protein FQR65_LT15507 [Abscondita terminalis]|nr:hypothetical protein FQR65_LT15507 [Abscondita terminalis]
MLRSERYSNRSFGRLIYQGAKGNEAVKGSEIAYFTLGLPISSDLWEQQFPLITQNVIDACKINNAKLVFFDNTYMYPQDNRVLNEQTPFAPVGRKGKKHFPDFEVTTYRQGIRTDKPGTIFSNKNKSGNLAMYKSENQQMKTPAKVIRRISCIAIQFLGLAKPSNPLISVFNFDDVKLEPETILSAVTTDFYVVALKKDCAGGKCKIALKASGLLTTAKTDSISYLSFLNWLNDFCGNTAYNRIIGNVLLKRPQPAATMAIFRQSVTPCIMVAPAPIQAFFFDVDMPGGPGCPDSGWLPGVPRTSRLPPLEYQ